MSSNGNLAPSELALIPNNADISTDGNQYIAVGALPYLLAAAAEFRQRIGVKVYVKEAYRPYATQEDYFLDRYVQTPNGSVVWQGKRWSKRSASVATAAVPGTSIHGVGDAIDIWSGIDTSFTSANHKAWVSVAAKYGWKNTGTAFGEPWHQEWSRARVTTVVASSVSIVHPGGANGAALVAKPTTPEFPKQEEDPMTILITHPAGQFYIFGGIVVDQIGPSAINGTSVTSGPALQVISTTTAVADQIRLRAALGRDDRILCLVQRPDGSYSGYALLEDRRFSVVTSMDTVNALTQMGVPTVTITAAQFNSLAKDYS